VRAFPSLFAAALGVVSMTVQAAQMSHSPDPIEINLTPSAEAADHYRVGDHVGLALVVSCKNVPSGFSVYLVLHPLMGDALVTPSGGKLRLQGLSFNGNASPVFDGDGGLFQIGAANYPRHLQISQPALESMAGLLLGPEKAKPVAEAFGPQGITLALGFLASLGRGGDRQEKAFFSFVLPRLPNAYDGVLISPVLMREGEKENEYRIAFSSSEMHSLRIAVASQ
jgi:hypothetical protein